MVKVMFIRFLHFFLGLYLIYGFLTLPAIQIHSSLPTYPSPEWRQYCFQISLPEITLQWTSLHIFPYWLVCVFLLKLLVHMVYVSLIYINVIREFSRIATSICILPGDVGIKESSWITGGMKLFVGCRFSIL